MVAPQNRTRFTRLWDQLGKVIDDLPDDSDGGGDLGTPQFGWKVGAAPAAGAVEPR